MVDREKKEHDIGDEEWDENSLRCVECKIEIDDGDVLNEVIDIIEKSRDNA